MRRSWRADPARKRPVAVREIGPDPNGRTAVIQQIRRWWPRGNSRMATILLRPPNRSEPGIDEDRSRGIAAERLGRRAADDDDVFAAAADGLKLFDAKNLAVSARVLIQVGHDHSIRSLDG